MTPASNRAAVMPVTFSDLTAFEVTGLEWRQVRKICRTHGVPIAKLGRRCIVRTDAWIAAIDRAAGVASEPAPAWSRADVVRAIGGAR